MQFTAKQIEGKLYKEFSSRYKAFGGFIDSEYWKQCLSAVQDETLLGHMIFCNDVLNLPPAHVFLRAKQIPKKLTETEKRSIGAFWGFVFRFVFGYQHQQSVTIILSKQERDALEGIAAVRTATYFFGVKEPVEIAKELRKGGN